MSLQRVPSALFVTAQMLLMQAACWHWLPGVGHSLAVLQTTHPDTGVPAQTPLVHTSLLVQGLPSLHVDPLGLLSTPQTLLMQVACWHWPGGVGHSAAVLQAMQPATGVPAQTPLLHWSLLVHGLPSLQPVPSVLFRIPQVPFAWQKASVQAVVPGKVAQSEFPVHSTQP